MNSTVLNKILKKTAVIAFWLGLWAVISYIVNKEILIVSPLETLRRLSELGQTTKFWTAALSSLFRVLIGFICGTVSGAVLGAVCAGVPFLKELLSPIVTAMRATPVASFIILALVWIKGDNVPTFIVAMIVFPLIFVDTFTGIKAAPRDLLEMADSFKVPTTRRIRYIYLPTLQPFFTSGCAAALGLAWKSGIAAEVLSTPKNSVGLMLNNAKIYVETADLFAWTVVVIILSMIFEFLLMRLIKSAGNIVIKRRFSTKVYKVLHENVPFAQKANINARLTKSFGDKKVLCGFDIELKNGINLLSGASGSGKTTVLRLLAGLEADDSGTRFAASQRPAVMFQEDRLLENATVGENILFVNRGAEVKKLLKAVELDGHENDMPSMLSGGMKRRVALARTLGFDGDAIFLDEPFKGLDADMRERVAKNMWEIIGDTPTLLITHDEVGTAQYAQRLELPI